MVVRGPGFRQFEQFRRSPGQEGRGLLYTGALKQAGLTAAVLGVGVVPECQLNFEVGLVLAGGVPLGVAGAGLGAVADGALAGSPVGLLYGRFRKWTVLD